MKKNDILKNFEDYILGTYTRMPGIFVKGKCMTLTDISGEKYLDFFPGWGVSNIGHCHPKVMSAVRDQIGKLIHIPNNLYHLHQAKLAKEIVRWSFPGKAFFCNSGAEACEAAIKFARAFGQCLDLPLEPAPDFAGRFEAFGFIVAADTFGIGGVAFKE